MKCIGIRSLRGGDGATSIASMLGSALNSYGESVLLIDLNPEDLLRLHFNVPYLDEHGWAAALANGTPWHKESFEISSGLMLLPFGRKHTKRPDYKCSYSKFWLEALDELKNAFKWVIFDMPSNYKRYSDLYTACNMRLLVMQPDIASSVLLDQAGIDSEISIIINKFNPAYKLANDVALNLRYSYGKQMVPVSVCHDENVHESLAHKQPVTLWSPNSSAAADAHTLSVWCMAQG